MANPLEHYKYDPETEVPFIQFLRPDGRQRPCSIVRPDPIPALAQRLLAAGCRLEIEELRDGTISMAVEHDGPLKHETWAHELCPNGPPVLDAVNRLITCAALRLTADTEPS